MKSGYNFSRPITFLMRDRLITDATRESATKCFRDSTPLCFRDSLKDDTLPPEEKKSTNGRDEVYLLTTISTRS